MKKILSVVLVVALALCSFAGCAQEGEDSTDDTVVNITPIELDFATTDEEIFTERDDSTEYDENSAVTIQLNKTGAVASSNSVIINGTTITITEEATYIVTGELKDGTLVVNAPDTAKPQIVLNGANITSETSAALYILEADKVFLTLAEGTTNTLANKSGFVAIDDNNIDAALFSKQDLTLNGEGMLTVTSPAGHGIVCKDDLAITSGTCVVKSAAHGISANDSIRLAKATLTIDSGKDAIHAENTQDNSLGFIYISDGTIKAESEGDAISAGAYMQIQSGEFDLIAGGGARNGTKESSSNYGGFMGGGPGGMRPGNMQTNVETTDDGTSMKGIKATGSILISDGTFTVDSADDCIHSDISVALQGGTFTLSSGDDAVHAEENLVVTAGKIDVLESYEGLEALCIDIEGGDIKLKATDDGLNAAGGNDGSGTSGGRDGMFGGGRGGGPGQSSGNGSIVISGGNIYINASGDGIDANGTLEISGGYIRVVGPTHGDTSTLDCDRSATISAGTFIGTGAATGMAQSFSDSSQGVIALSVGNQAAGTKITIKDKGGNVLIEHSPELDFALVICSSPDIKKGETYSITIGTQTGDFAAN